MAKARPIRERELLMDDNARIDLRRKIDPLIDVALKSRGFTEERTPAGRIYLDGSRVLASAAFRNTLQQPYDGLAVSTEHSVAGEERFLTRSSLELVRIGGFTASRIVTVGDRYYFKSSSPNNRSKEEAAVSISESDLQDILQDVRAHTELGYSSSDSPVPFAQTIEELELLHDARAIDRRANYQLLTSQEHGDIQMNIGESFELRNIKVGNRLQKRRFKTKKLFEIIAKQPLDDGHVELGIHYRSGRDSTPEIKISADIIDTNYSEEEKQALYDDMVQTYQESDVRKFGRGATKNLQMIADESSNIIRIG